MNNKDIALKYLHLGFSVIPTRGKKPLVEWLRYSKEKPTEQQIIEWWSKWPDADIACPTGAVSGIVVVDIDGGQIPELPYTIYSETSSGHFQYFFKHPGFSIQNSVKIVEKNIDIRGDGGFVVLPPSRHFNKETGEQDFIYKWIKSPEDISLADLPAWILEKTKEKKSVQALVQGSSQGSRNNDAASLIGSLLTKYPQYEWESVCWPLVEAWNNNNNPPLSSQELRSVFNSITTRQVSQDYSGKKTINAPKIDYPQPIAKEAYYGLAGEIVSTIEPHSESDPVALLLNLLTAFGNIIGDGSYCEIESRKHPCRLFVCIVGLSSKARKGTSWGQIEQLFTVIDPFWKSQSGLSSGEGVIWHVRNPIEKTNKKGEAEIIDSGVSDKRLLLVEPEFSSVLQAMAREKNTLSAIIRKAWENGNLQSMTKNSPLKADGAHVSILAHITTYELVKLLTDTDTVNGFGNRFLWVIVNRSKLLPRGGGNFNIADEHSLVTELRRVTEFAKNAGKVEPSDETWALWDYIYPELSSEQHGMFGAMVGRVEAYARRLSTTYALLDKSNVVQPEHLMAALAILDYVEASIHYIFQDQLGDLVVNKILFELENKPEGLSLTDINNVFNRHETTERLSTALSYLLRLGKIKETSIPTAGRDVTLFSLNSQYTNKTNQGYLGKIKQYATEKGIKYCEKSELSLSEKTIIAEKAPESSITAENLSIEEKENALDENYQFTEFD